MPKRTRRLISRRKLCPTCLAEIRIDEQHAVDKDGNASPVSLKRSKSERERIEALGSGQVLVCPYRHPLPFDFWDTEQSCYALIGPSRSMKSHFIEAVCTGLLAGTPPPLGGYGVTVEPSLETNERMRVHYTRRVQRERKIIDRTQLEDQDNGFGRPITLRVNASTMSNTGSLRSFYASMFDAPGELLMDVAQQAKHASYIGNADGMAFFVDVNGLASVQRQMRGRFDEESDMFDTVVFQAVRRLRNEHANETSDVPAAIVFSRADVLAHIADDIELAEWVRAKTAAPSDGLDIDAVTQDDGYMGIRFAQRYAPALFDLAHQKFERPGFFLASALAAEPTDGMIREDPHSWGCVEVFAWMLFAEGRLY